MSHLNIPASPVSQNKIIPCQICGKDSNYSCYNCQKTNYCSKQHQKEHWKVHKNNCNKKKNAQSEKVMDLQKQILEARKNFYQNYSNKIFNHCLLDAKLMTGLSKALLDLEPTNITFQLQYGASVSAMVRTHTILNDLANAKHELQNYLAKHKHFLEDMAKYKNMINAVHTLKEEEKQELQSKLNLISGIANLCYIIGMNTEEYYVLYAKYVVACFGEDSFEASNCYFLLGTFFSEEGWFNKAIACFQKSAKIRGQFAGDCMFNIGVLHRLMGNLPNALQTLEVSLKLRQEQYGQDSNEVAEVNELMGTIYTDLNDYKTALAEYEKAFRVRCTNPISPQFQNVLDLVHDLYDKLCLYIRMGQPNMKRPQIYTHLRQQIKGQNSYWEHSKYRKKRQLDDENNEKEQVETVEKYKKKKVAATDDDQKFSWKLSGLFNLTSAFIETLNLSELFRLSQLQIELENCDSVFSLIYIVGTSSFFESLRSQQKMELEVQNPRLFELMKLEDIKRLKHKDK